MRHNYKKEIQVLCETAEANYASLGSGTKVGVRFGSAKYGVDHVVWVGGVVGFKSRSLRDVYNFVYGLGRAVVTLKWEQEARQRAAFVAVERATRQDRAREVHARNLQEIEAMDDQPHFSESGFPAN